VTIARQLDHHALCRPRLPVMFDWPPHRQDGAFLCRPFWPRDRCASSDYQAANQKLSTRFPVIATIANYYH
jgi:hypothetical protein